MPQDKRNIYKIAREAKGLTQEAAAEELGISDSSIRAYETGQRIPPPEVVDLMVIAYDSQLLGIQHLRASADMARSIVPDIREVRLPEAIMELLDRVYGFVDAHRDRELLRIDWLGILICIFYGASSYGVCFVTYNVAVERIPVSVATVLMFISPVWVTLLNWLVFHEKPDRLKTFAIALCFCGAILVADLLHTDPSARMDPAGIFAGVLNSFGMALQLLIPRYFAQRYQKDTMLVYGFLGAALVLAFLSDFGRIGAGITGSDGPAVVLCILALGILCTLGANGFYVKATAYIDTTSVSILSALEVVVGSIVGFLVFHESMRLSQVIGALTIMVGALLPNVREKLRSRKTA